jgi:hypothetical protein
VIRSACIYVAVNIDIGSSSLFSARRWSAQAPMKVVVIKACDDREFGYICDHQASAAQAHHTTGLQLSQDPIDVHWCQAERIAENNLRKRHLKSIANR